MAHKNMFSRLLNASAVISLSSILLNSLFMVASWGMDPPPKEESLSLSKKPKKSQSNTDEKGGSPKKERTGMKAKIKKKFGAKTKAKANVKDTQPAVGPETPTRPRAATVTQPLLTPQADFPSPRQRSNTFVVPEFKPLPGSKKRSNSLMNSTRLPPPAQPERTYEKLITSKHDLDNALNPKIKDLSSPENYKSIKIVITSKDPLNDMEIPFQKLFQQFSKITALHISGLILGGTEAGDLRMQTLVKVLPYMLLEKLAFENCGIHETGMKWLASILFIPTHADANTHYLAATLKELDLSYNNLGNGGAQNIEKSLKKNFTITNLNLAHNQIGDAGAENLAGLLNGHSVLKTVQLMNNKITGRGILIFLSALNECSDLTVYLGNNSLAIDDHYELLVLEDSVPESLCLIPNKKLGIIWENDKLYCKTHDKEKIEIPFSEYSTEGLHPNTYKKISQIFKTGPLLKDGVYIMPAEALVNFKQEILQYTWKIGYTSGLQNQEVLLDTLAERGVKVYLPETPPPYKAKLLDESE